MNVEQRTAVRLLQAASLPLSASQASRKPVTETGESFDIAALLHDVSETVRSIVRDKPITIMDSSFSGPVMIPSDQGAIIRIMTGLMSNAAMFTDRGRISLILCREPDEIRLTIADTGRGMTREQLNAVQTSSDYGYADGQIGVGTSGPSLRIVKALVKQLHGGFSIASKAGAGTIVTVSLPHR